MANLRILTCLVIFFAVSKVGEAGCSFPGYTLGYWVDSVDKSVIQFQQQVIQNFHMDTYVLDMHCYLNMGTKYVLKTNIEHPMFDEFVWIYVCWELVQQSPTTFLMYQLSDLIGQNTADRGRAYLVKDNTVIDIASICTLSPSTSPQPLTMTKLTNP